jgi:hypothetical protein
MIRLRRQKVHSLHGISNDFFKKRFIVAYYRLINADKELLFE